MDHLFLHSSDVFERLRRPSNRAPRGFHQLGGIRHARVVGASGRPPRAAVPTSLGPKQSQRRLQRQLLDCQGHAGMEDQPGYSAVRSVMDPGVGRRFRRSGAGLGSWCARSVHQRGRFSGLFRNLSHDQGQWRRLDCPFWGKKTERTDRVQFFDQDVGGLRRRGHRSNQEPVRLVERSRRRHGLGRQHGWLFGRVRSGSEPAVNHHSCNVPQKQRDFASQTVHHSPTGIGFQ